MSEPSAGPVPAGSLTDQGRLLAFLPVPAATSPARSVGDAGRIVWLDLLRALAVLLVTFGHVFMVGINDWRTVNLWLPLSDTFLFGPDTPVRNGIGHWGDRITLATGSNVGGFGVALFFLISGYVILRTIDRTLPVAFLIRRVFRIFPLCVVAVVATAAGTALYCHWVGVPTPYSPRSVLFSALAMPDFFSAFPVIPVLWTLKAELAFYLLVAIAACTVPRIRLGTLAGLAVGCLCGVLLAEACRIGALLPTPVLVFVLQVSGLLVYVNFMLIGAALYRGHVDGRKVAGAAVAGAIGVVFVLSYLFFQFQPQGISLADAFYAILLFIAAAWLKPRGAWSLPLRWVADISYPLYLVHVPLAWGCLAFFARAGLGPTVSGFLSIGVVGLVAWALHEAVEKPGNRLGNWLARPRAKRRA